MHVINDAAVTGSPAAVVASETIMPDEDEEADVVAADDARPQCNYLVVCCDAVYMLEQL